MILIQFSSTNCGTNLHRQMSRHVTHLLAVLLAVTSLLPDSYQAGKFWHITDLHLDYDYSTHGDVEKMCHFTNDSSIDGNLGPAGNYKCDAPYILVKSLLQAMKRLEPNPDFIVWTGDSGPHVYNPQPSVEYITNVTSMVFSELGQLFPDKPIIPALGNHDSFPADNYPQSTDTKDTDSQYYKYMTEGGFGKHINVSEEAVQTFLQCGNYFKTIKDSNEMEVRFVVLNTNIYYYNKAKVSEDPCGQIQWLNKTLSMLNQDEKVFIVAHVPPGSYEISPGVSFFNYNNTGNDVNLGPELEKEYVSLISDPDLHKHIHAHLYGHVHSDSFRLYLSRTGDDRVRGVAFLASSGTPMLGSAEGVNPGMRLFEYDDGDGTLLDYQQFGLDLDALDFTQFDQKEEESKSTERTTIRERRSVTESQEDITTTMSTIIPQDTEATTDINQTSITTIKPESQENMQNQTHIFGHRGENPTPYDAPVNTNETKIFGHRGENPTPFDAPQNANITNQNTTQNDANITTVNNDNAAMTSQLIDAISANFTSMYYATKAFNVNNLSADEMGRAFNGMTQDSEEFKAYYAHNTNNHPNGDGVCNSTCYRNQMCTIKHSVTEELNECRLGNESLKVVIANESSQSNESVTMPPVTQGTTLPTPTERSTREFSPLFPTAVPAVPSTTEPPQEPTPPFTEPPPVVPSRRPLIPKSSPRPREPTDLNDEDIELDNNEDVQSESTKTGSEIAGVILGAGGAILLFIVFGIAMRKYRQRRYRDQEFLLTDSVFRYDGYNQLDDDF